MEIYGEIFLLFSLVTFVRSQANVSTWPAGTYVPNSCLCAPTGQCSLAGGGAPNDGSGMLEARIQSPNAPQSSGLATGTTSFLTQPIHTGINIVSSNMASCASPTSLDRCCPTNGYTCGVRYPPVANSPSPSQAFQAQYGAYPYQGVLLSQLNEYIGSCVLIDHLHALTVAHKVVNSQSQLKLRLGEWDASNVVEPFSPIEINVTWYAHPNFTAANLKHNIAVLRLSTPVQLGAFPTIGNICLPNTTLSNLRCWVSGWGKDQFGTNGSFQNIIKEVDVPLITAATCQDMLRATRLGPNFQFDSNCFVCAGGEAGKDACTGDGGAPLSCFVGDRFYLAGLVAWGIGCGSANSPGVYTNIQTYVPWIQNTIANWATLTTVATTGTPIGSRISTTTTTPALGGSTQTSTTVASTASTLPSSTTSTTVPPTTTTTSTTRAPTTSTLAPTTTTTLAPTTTLPPTVVTTTSTTVPPTTSTTRAPTTTLAPTTSTLAPTTTTTSTTTSTTSTTRAPTTTQAPTTTTTLAPTTTRAPTTTLPPFTTTPRATTRTTTSTTTTTTEEPTTEEETSPPEYYYYEEATEAPEEEPEEPVEATAKPQNSGGGSPSRVTSPKPGNTISARFTARKTTTKLRVQGVRDNSGTTRKPQVTTPKNPQATTMPPRATTRTVKTTKKAQVTTTKKSPQVTTPSKATTKVTTPKSG